MDDSHQIIVAEAVTNQPPDVEHLVPMLEQVVENCGAAPKTLTAAAGYTLLAVAAGRILAA